MARNSNPENREYYARKYMLSLTDTESINKLEVMLREDAALKSIAKYAIGGFLYYSDKNIDKVSHPNLWIELDNYSRSLILKNKPIDKDEYKNKYWETEAIIKFKSEKTSMINESKEIIAAEIEKEIIKHNLSISSVAKLTDCKQPHLYNYVVKSKLDSLSYEKAKNILREIRKHYE